MKTLFLFFAVVVLNAGCASSSKTSAPSGLDAQLKVTGANSVLKAKLLLKNSGSKEIVLNDLNSRYFKVVTLDNKPVETKANSGKPSEVVRVKPGETVETTFALQDNYSFWDRLTRYKVWYEGPNLKTEPVQVWF